MSIEELRERLVALRLPLNELPYYETYILTGKVPREAFEKSLLAIAHNTGAGFAFGQDLLKMVYKHHPELFENEELRASLCYD